MPFGRNRTSILLCAVAVAAQTQAGEPSDKPSTASVSVAPENGGPRNWEVTVVSRVLNHREEPSTTAHMVAGYLTSPLEGREAEVPIYKKTIYIADPLSAQECRSVAYGGAWLRPMTWLTTSS
jgi:hypothetical protein